MNKEVIAHLRDLGMSANEAKVYTALLKHNPSTGYQIARASGVRRGVVYEVLRSLAERGAIFTVNAKVSRYMPVNPREFLGAVQERSQKIYTSLRKELGGFKLSGPEESFLNIQGYAALLDKARALIRAAKKSIYLSARKREIELLRPLLQESLRRRCRLRIFSFSQVAAPLGQNYCHNIPEEKLDRVPNFRRLTLAVDGREVLIGEAEDSEDTVSLWTRNPSLVNLGREHITHDIYLVKIWRKFGDAAFHKILAEEDREIQQHWK